MNLDVDEAKSQSQRIFPIEDDTDMEAAANFDYNEYLKSQGISTVAADTPDEIL